MNRKTFFIAGATASAFAAGTITEPASAASVPKAVGRPYAPVLLPGQYDAKAMWRAIDANGATRKQLFLCNPDLLAAPGVSATFLRMVNAWNASLFSFGPVSKEKRLAVSAVLISQPVVFALNDTMWKKYHIARTLNVTDRSGTVAIGNPTRAAWGSLDLDAGPNNTAGIYHDYSSDALLARGASFLVCHNAIAGISARFAQSTGIPHGVVLNDWSTNLLPGFNLVPAGAAYVQLAQENGWKLYPITD